MDKIKLKNIKFFAYHGVSKEEKKIGQRFALDVELTTDFSFCIKSDDIKKTVNYELVFQLTKKIFCNNKWNLLETAASEIAKGITNLKGVYDVKVVIRKLNPPIKDFNGCFEVEYYHKGRA